MSIYSFPARLGIHRSVLTFYAIIHRKFALQLFDVKLCTKVAYIIGQSLAKFQGDQLNRLCEQNFFTSHVNVSKMASAAKKALVGEISSEQSQEPN